MSKFLFSESLVDGLILSRPNRFIMEVEHQGRKYRAHCPSTGRISNLVWEDIPCLLSPHGEGSRKTAFTVEAISLDPTGRRDKSWIGINQSMANNYVDHFLRGGDLASMVPRVEEVRREVRLGSSRIDFLVNGTVHVEVKTPLKDIPCGGHPKCRETVSPFLGFERTIKHFHDIATSVGEGARAVVLMCYLYDAKPFVVPVPDRNTIRIQEAAVEAVRHGVENWQLNLRVDREGVEYLRCFKLDLFSNRRW